MVSRLIEVVEASVLNVNNPSYHERTTTEISQLNTGAQTQVQYDGILVPTRLGRRQAQDRRCSKLCAVADGKTQ